jgi:hypothetical protein
MIKRNAEGKVIEFEDEKAFLPSTKQSKKASRENQSPIPLTVEEVEALHQASVEAVLVEMEQNTKAFMSELEAKVVEIDQKKKKAVQACREICVKQKAEARKAMEEAEKKADKLFEENRRSVLDVYYDQMKPLNDVAEKFADKQKAAVKDALEACEKVKEMHLAEVKVRQKQQEEERRRKEEVNTETAVK